MLSPSLSQPSPTAHSPIYDIRNASTLPLRRQRRQVLEHRWRARAKKQGSNLLLHLMYATLLTTLTHPRHSQTRCIGHSSPLISLSSSPILIPILPLSNHLHRCFTIPYPPSHRRRRLPGEQSTRTKCTLRTSTMTPPQT